MRRGIVFVALAIIVVATLSPVGRCAERPPVGVPIDPMLQPPPYNGRPFDITIGLHVINLAEIEEVRQQFELNAYMFAQWVDPRLAFTPRGPDERQRDYEMGQIWVPQLEIINAAQPRTRYDTSIQVDPDGTVHYAERFRAPISSHFKLRRFPFDRQALVIIIHPFLVDGPHIRFKLGDNSMWTAREFESYSSLAQWTLTAVHPQVGTAPTYGGFTMPEARFEIFVQRRSSFYVWKVFLPLLLMVFLSWAVFWIEAGDLTNQVTVAVTTILTVIAFAFAISATMPRLPYLTYIDAFFLECYIFVFLAVVELMTVHVTHRSERRRDLGLQIRNYSRWVIPAAFVVSNVIIAAHFLA